MYLLEIGGRLNKSRETLRKHIQCFLDKKYLTLFPRWFHFFSSSVLHRSRGKKSRIYNWIWLHRYTICVSLFFPILAASWGPASWICVARANCAGVGSLHAHTSLPLAVSYRKEPTASCHPSAALISFENLGTTVFLMPLSPSVSIGVHWQRNQWLRTVMTSPSLTAMPHWGVLMTHSKYGNPLITPQQLLTYVWPFHDVRETTAQRVYLRPHWEVALA